MSNVINFPTPAPELDPEWDGWAGAAPEEPITVRVKLELPEPAPRNDTFASVVCFVSWAAVAFIVTYVLLQ